MRNNPTDTRMTFKSKVTIKKDHQTTGMEVSP